MATQDDAIGKFIREAKEKHDQQRSTLSQAAAILDVWADSYAGTGTRRQRMIMTRSRKGADLLRELLALEST
jgi:hypothetical protein